MLTVKTLPTALPPPSRLSLLLRRTGSGLGMLCAALLLCGTALPAAAQASGASRTASASTPRQTQAAAPNARKTSARTRTRSAGTAAAAGAAAAGAVAALGASRWKDPDGVAEQRLLEVLDLTSAGQTQQALDKAYALVGDYPHFQLAQLALGDLLLARSRPLEVLGNTTPTNEQAAQTLESLRSESLKRISAQKTALPAGAIPQQFLLVPPSSRHAIAVDAKFSRLYLFENTDEGMRLVADYYASVGKLGTEKEIEGDQRTPLGVYFVVSKLQASALPPFYGAGALPLNYPNPLDQRRGKTGHGIWLHGTPPDQFARAPLATDGCVALADPDFYRLLQTVDIRSTPVVIANELQWVQPQSMDTMRQAFDLLLQSWHQAKTDGDVDLLLSFYAPDFTGSKKMDLATWSNRLIREVKDLSGRSLELKERSYLRWSDAQDDVMVVTFGEVMQGSISGPVRRQYWRRDGQLWHIFFESTV